MSGIAHWIMYKTHFCTTKEICLMRFKDYGRNQKKRKDYVQQPGSLLVEIDGSEAKHDACMKTQDIIICTF